MNPFNLFWRILDTLDAIAYGVCGLLAAVLLAAFAAFVVRRRRGQK